MSDARPETSAPSNVVALRHSRESGDAPRVVAKGRGEVAERILAFARECGVPVREDRDLLQMLSACEIGEEIPVELYEVVARLLAYLYGLNEELRTGP
jgi:flagellar biosynthesis protein